MVSNKLQPIEPSSVFPAKKSSSDKIDAIFYPPTIKKLTTIHCQSSQNQPISGFFHPFCTLIVHLPCETHGHSKLTYVHRA